MALAKTTTNHDEIRRWVEKNGGCPARVKATGRTKDDPGILQIDYPGFSGKTTLAPMAWDEWFEAFDENGLAFVYQPSTRFSKLVARGSAQGAPGARRTATAGRRGAKAKSRGAKKVSTRTPKRTSARRATTRSAKSTAKSSPNSTSKRPTKRTARKATKRTSSTGARRTARRPAA